MYHLEHFKIIQKVAHDWQKLASLLGLSDVERAIHYDTVKFGCESSCRETFRRWLAGEGCQPVTWERLIEVLRDAEKSEYAKDLEEHFQIKVSNLWWSVHY